MNIECTEKNGNLIVKVRGEIDHHTASNIRTVIEKEYSSTRAKNIVFDFLKTSFMDSSGIGVIIGRYKELKTFGGKVFAINIPPEINRIFTISGLRKIIHCIETIEEVQNQG